MLHGVPPAVGERGVRRPWWVPALAVLAGCTAVAPRPAPPPAPTASSILLASADGLLVRGDYNQARQAYAEFARQYPDDGATARARATRDVLDVLIATREEVARIDEEMLEVKEQVEAGERELAHVRRNLSTRDTELVQVRQVLAERQAELARLRAEAEQLRADLEKLKDVDLRLERRR